MRPPRRTARTVSSGGVAVLASLKILLPPSYQSPLSKLDRGDKQSAGGGGLGQLDAEIAGRRVAAPDEQQHRTPSRRAGGGHRRRGFVGGAGGTLVDREDDVADLDALPGGI